MEFKKKIKNLLQKEGLHKVQKALSSSSNSLSESSLVPPSIQILPVSRDSESELRLLATDPEADEAVIKTIHPMFFTSPDNFDPSLYELKKLPDEVDREYIQLARKRLLKELTVVSKKVFQAILEKQSCYTSEIQRIREVEDNLDAAISTCQDSRLNLALSKQQFTEKSLGFLANYKKRQVASKLLNSLRIISTLQRTQVRLTQLLVEGDYPGGIQLLLECSQAAVTYSHFNCVSELSKKLQETLENAEEQLDVALSKVCLHFEEKHYANLQKAYKLLGKTHTCMDQIQMHYATAIHNSAFSVVHGYVELCRIDDQQINLQRKQYQDLCSCLTQEIFIPCLLDLCKALWKILLSYHHVVNWHSKQSKLFKETQNQETNQDQNLENNHEYVEQKLLNGSFHIWQDCQTKIKTFLLSFDFTSFKIDEFMQILSIIHQLKAVGSEFCNSESESLQDCIRQASLRYFRRYHLMKLEELRIFLENESWEVCPVRSDFDINKLHEFKFLKDDTSSARVVGIKNSETREKRRIFEKFEKLGSPFDIQKEDSEENIFENMERESCAGNETILAQNEENSESSDESEGIENESDKSLLLITNTALSILRLFGKYLHLMHLLKSIAYDVALCVSQLFEYYFFSVFMYFASENGEVTIEKISNAQLRLALIRIRDNLIKKENDPQMTNGKVSQTVVNSIYERLPCLRDEENLYGLAQRIVASESCVYLANQMDMLKTYIEGHLPPDNWELIAQLIDQAVIVSGELRRPIFAPITCRAVDYNHILNFMEKVNWEVKEIMSQHSSYVDFLLRNLQVFLMKLEQVATKVHIPKGVHTVVWEQIFRFCSRVFVDGFSGAKKCSQGGRGLMQLDFMQFFSKIESMAPISFKGSPDRDFVENYVKAYYMPDTIMEEWLKKHSEYSGKQLNALVNCSQQGNKRTKQRLLSIIEDIEKMRR